MGKQNIVIVGGGAAGVNAARVLSPALDPAKYNLILINPLPYRIWLIAALRVVVSPDEQLQKDTMLPYDKVFTNGNGKFVEGVVKSIQPEKEGGGSVTLESGESIDYRILILAQGATWRGPVAFPRTDAEVRAHIKSLHAKFSKAKDIVLVGGGAVGFELAGEIKDIWPNKKVTIVHADKQLFNSAYPDKMRRAAAASMRKRGIEVVLGDYVDITETIEVQGLTTRSGKALGSADLVVQTRGPVPNTAFVAESLGASALSDRDLIRVLPTLQLQEHPSIFAAGDVIEWKEQKQAAKSSAQGVLVGGNVLAYLSGGKMVPYKGKFEMIIATNGKGGGVAYLDVLWGLLFGDWFAKMVKAKGLLVPMFKGQQGY